MRTRTTQKLGHGTQRRSQVFFYEKKYLSGEWDLKRFMGEYRDPGNYQVEDPLRNRSHIDE
jgi:hypothetical protein